MKKKIMQAFKALGFRLEKFDDDSYSLMYEGTKLLWMQMDDDDDFLLIIVPLNKDVSGFDELEFYKTIDRFNGMIKYIKAATVSGTLWLRYERELFDDDPETLESILTSMVVRLDSSLSLFYKMLSDLEEEDDEDSDNVPLLIDDVDDIDDIDEFEDLDEWEEVDDINE